MKVYLLRETNWLPILLSLIIFFFPPSASYAGTASLTWEAPTNNVDGTSLTNLSGYKVYYGTSSGNYTNVVSVGNVVTYAINNLTDGQTYYFAVTAYNSSGSESDFSNEVTKIISSGNTDTTPPSISSVYSTSLTSGSATIGWTTNEASDTQIEYGTSTSYGNTTTLNSTLTTAHSQTLSNLSASTTYHYRVRSRDAVGNLSISSDYTFTTSALADTTAPTISNVLTANITSSSATITWTTNEPATTQVEYGTATSYGRSSTLDSTLTTTHSVSLNGLSGFTTYNFRVRSADSSNNTGVSSNYTFTTSNTSPSFDSFSASIYTGTAPINIDFTASASDADGYITRYEWDLDGDGQYETDTGAVSYTSYTYTKAGNYKVRGRVTDNGGATVTSSNLTISISTATNRPPKIRSFKFKQNMDPVNNITSWVVPQSVTFTVDATDEDGTIVQYDWDFDGNGTIDATTDSGTISYVYTIAATYTPRVTVTDDMGGTAVEETTVVISAAEESGDSSVPTDSGSSSSSGGGCFIATAAYGSYLDPHVMVLRKLRDNYLLTNSAGRAFVKLYYRTSPPLAEYIAKHKSLRLITRSALTPIIYGVEYPIIAMGLLISSAAAALTIRRRRREQHI